jgi:hypothetical protein
VLLKLIYYGLDAHTGVHFGVSRLNYTVGHFIARLDA